MIRLHTGFVQADKQPVSSARAGRPALTCNSSACRAQRKRGAVSFLFFAFFFVRDRGQSGGALRVNSERLRSGQTICWIRGPAK